jgi:hypothetical protein
MHQAGKLLHRSAQGSHLLLASVEALVQSNILVLFCVLDICQQCLMRICNPISISTQTRHPFSLSYPHCWELGGQRTDWITRSIVRMLCTHRSRHALHPSIQTLPSDNPVLGRLHPS